MGASVYELQIKFRSMAGQSVDSHIGRALRGLHGDYSKECGGGGGYTKESGGDDVEIFGEHIRYSGNRASVRA